MPRPPPPFPRFPPFPLPPPPPAAPPFPSSRTVPDALMPKPRTPYPHLLPFASFSTPKLEMKCVCLNPYPRPSRTPPTLTLRLTVPPPFPRFPPFLLPPPPPAAPLLPSSRTVRCPHAQTPSPSPLTLDLTALPALPALPAAPARTRCPRERGDGAGGKRGEGLGSGVG